MHALANPAPMVQELHNQPGAVPEDFFDMGVAARFQFDLDATEVDRQSFPLRRR